MTKYFILFSILISFSSYSQSLKEINKLNQIHQDCLDHGKGMKHCAGSFYVTTDSLLNVSYNNLKKKLSLPQQNKLKLEQRKWLKERDNYFIKARIETINENVGDEGSNDFDMILYEKESEFVFKRVTELIKQRNKITFRKT